MTGKLALSTMKLPFMAVPELGGAFYLRAAASKLPWKAKKATLMVETYGHLENIGWYQSLASRCIRLEVSQRLPPRAWTWA